MDYETLTTGRTFPHLRGVDGLRGAAVAAVVAYHLDRSGLQGGFLGVSLFFTLSGFLITWMLLREHATRASISLGAFWERRGRRLLPAALLTLLVMVVAAATGVFDDAAKVINDALASLFYAANWRQLATGSSYAGQFSLPSPLVHFWSLAIEEQFYLVYPLLAWALLRRGRTRFAAALVVLTAASVYSQLHFSYHFDRVYYGTDTRMSELTIGALLALAMTRPDGWLRLVPRPLRVISKAAPLITIAAWSSLTLGSDVFGRGGFAIAGVSSAFTILWALTEPAILTNRLMLWLGSRSYAIYLFHWPIVVLTEEQADGPARWWVMALRVSATLLLAELSFRFVEQPIRQRRVAVRLWWPRVVGALAALSVLSLLVLNSAPRDELNSVLASASESMPDVPSLPPIPAAESAASEAPVDVAGEQPPSLDAATAAPEESAAPADPANTTTAASVKATGTPSSTGPSTAASSSASTARPAGPPPQKVAIIGDSTGVAAGVGLATWGLTSGRALFYDLSVNGCSFVRSAAHRPSPSFPPFTEDKSCDAGQRWEKGLPAFAPDKVVVITSISALYSFKVRPGDNRWVSINDADGRAYIKSQYQAALATIRSLVAPTTPVVLATIPYNFWPMCTNPCDIRDHARADALNAVFAEMTQPDGSIVTVDYAGVVNGMKLGPKDKRRPDGLHFTKPASIALAGSWFGPALLAVPPATLAVAPPPDPDPQPEAAADAMPVSP